MALRPSSKRKPNKISLSNAAPELTSFVGRQRELAEIKSLLPRTRLLTLTGPGGCGKTRLALRVGADLAAAHAFKDGVWWVELAFLTDPTLVPHEAARALGVRETSDGTLTDALSNYLQSKNLLLILDNCEHLLPGCAQMVNTLLLSAPGLHILVTSREPLDVLGESTWLVPSLSMPDRKRPLRNGEDLPSKLMQYDAIQLFVERAASVLPSFTLTQQNVAGVVQICQRLDGIPLAIELAVARIQVLTVGQIAARLDDCFSLLTSGNRTALIPRHQTLRAAIDWSYDLLSEKERALFHRLSVFAGGFTLEAVEAICSGDGVGREEILDLLSQLVDKSLIVAQTRERLEARYYLLETIRQYGSEALQASGQSRIVQRNHAQFFCTLAEQTDPKLRGPDQVMWLDRLEMEHDNLRAALAWGLTYDLETALRLASALSWFWGRRDHFSEGRRWLDAALTASRGAPASLRVKGLIGAGLLAYAQADDTRAALLLDESLALARNQNDKRGIAWSLFGLARVEAYHGAYERVAAFLEESLAHFRDLGDIDGCAYSIQIQGVAARLEGQYEEAWKYLQESLSLARQVGDKWLIAWVLINGGRVAYAQGDYPQALALLQESLGLCRELKTARGISACLQLLTQLAGAQRKLEGAVRLFGAVASLDETYSFRAPLHNDRADIERSLMAARTELGTQAFAATWAEGRSLTLEQAAEEGLNLASSLTSDTVPVASHALDTRNSNLGQPLNERELQVLRLIADGLSNHEIADQLVIALSTVKWHINNLFSKLGVHSRTQAIARAKQLGLM